MTDSSGAARATSVIAPKAAQDEDPYVFCWVYNPLHKSDHDIVCPQLMRKGVGPKMLIIGAQNVLKPGEHWLPLGELMERYPLKVPK